jgi:hypothetical protein
MLEMKGWIALGMISYSLECKESRLRMNQNT